MKLADLDPRPPITLSPFSSTDEAVAAMSEHGRRHLLVVDQRRLAGLLTAAAMLESVAMLTLAERRRLGAPFSDEELCVADLMETEVSCVGADMPPGDAARLLAGEQFGALPVVAGDRPVGLLTDADVLRFLVDGDGLEASAEGTEPVQHFARPASGELSPADTIRTICGQFARRQAWALPVVEDRRFLGLVSVPIMRQAIDRCDADAWAALAAREIMANDVPTVGPEAPMRHAARLMLDSPAAVLPVTTGDNVLVGLLTTGDVLAAFTGLLNVHP